MTDAVVEVEKTPKIKPGQVIWGTGRRKTAVARVRLRLGSGKMVINDRPLEQFFPRIQDRLSVQAPLKAIEGLERYDITAKVNGGGPTGQAGAILLGISRALLKAEEHVEETLKSNGFLTRDSRMKERKKYGLRGARRAFQFSKR